RSFIALSALTPLGDELKVLADTDLADPLGTLGAWASYVGGRLRREVRPDSISLAHETLSELAGPVAGQVKRLRAVGESVLREHGSAIVDQGMTHKRLAGAPALFLIASIVQPDTDHKNKLRELNAIAAHKGTYLASGLLYLLAGIVLIAAAIGVIRLFRGPRGVTLGQISGALLVLGGTVSFGWYALGAAEYEMVNHTGLD